MTKNLQFGIDAKNMHIKRFDLPSIELLNSEGPYLVAYREDNTKYYIIEDQKEIVAILNQEEMEDFIHGDFVISNSNNKTYKYSTFSGDEKPDLKRLDEFIGINTAGKTY